jgi:hypothetical protein
MAWERRRQRLLVAGLIGCNLASLGSLPPKGSVTAELPPTQGVAGKGVIATIEATWEPYLAVEHAGQRFAFVSDYEDATEEWSGTKQLFVPADVTKADAVITGQCTGGCCDPCFDENAVFVRVTSAEFVDVWQLRSEPSVQEGTEVNWPAADYTVRVSSTGTPLINFRVDRSEPWGAGIEVRYTTVRGGGADFQIVISHPSDQETTERARVDWTVEAMASAPCPTPGPCEPGPDDRVTMSVTPGHSPYD